MLTVLGVMMEVMMKHSLHILQGVYKEYHCNIIFGLSLVLLPPN